jgi:hypothetical protein
VHERTTAYCDESFLEHPAAGFYVIAAALFDGEVEQAREAMLELRAPMSPGEALRRKRHGGVLRALPWIGLGR